MSTSPSRFLLTPPRLTPSPRRSLFETPAKPHRASLGGKSTTTKALLLLVAVASASFLAGTSLRHHYVAPLKTLPSATSLLPIPIPGWGDEAGGDGSEVFFHIEPFESGLNNERISLLKAAEVASRRNWTLVLPSYKDFHAVIAGDDSISTSSGFSPAVVLPFSHFYDERAFAAHAQSKGFRVVRSLPPNRFHACSKMMSLAAHWPQALTSSLLSGFSKEYGVVCLSAHAVWHAIQGYDLPDLDWSANSVHAAGLRPSELYERELERMVAAAAEKFGSGSSLSSSSSSSLSLSTASASASNSSLIPDFIAVHVRIEEDWKRVCAMGSDRRQSHWLAGDNKECLVGEAEIAESVVAREKERRGGGDEATLASSSSLSSPSSLKPGSLGDSRPLAFVMSAAPTSTMPRLCDPLSGALRCFTPDDVWLGPDPALLPFGRTKLVRSYVSFLFAKEKAAALFGNVHSTFSRELGDEMGARGKGVFYYNPDCADPGNCP